MIKSTPLTLLLWIAIGTMLLALQSAGSVYIHRVFAYPDFIIIMFVLLLFNFQSTSLKWLFIVGFVLGLIQAVWINQKLGIASFFYMIVSYNIMVSELIITKRVQVFIMTVVAFLLKFIVYLLFSLLFSDIAIYDFVLSIGFVYQIAMSIALVLIFDVLLSNILKRGKYYEN